MYVCRHKFFVFAAGMKTGVPLWRLLIHDYTKFSRSEWTPYVNKFMRSTKDPAEMNARAKAFGHAWHHHYTRNLHHWQYWIPSFGSNAGAPLEMPEHFVREMVADWMGAGRAITGSWDMSEWWDKNERRVVLHPKTRVLVIELLNKHALTKGSK